MASNMASKPSIVELEYFVKVYSKRQFPISGREEEVIVLSTNSDGTRKTVWGPVFFRPTGSVVSTIHPDKPRRRIIREANYPRIPLSAIDSKEWVKDERRQNPVIRIKMTVGSYLGKSGHYSTVICVFCFDTY
eukprot:scpid113055/ scgid32947/ 